MLISAFSAFWDRNRTAGFSLIEITVSVGILMALSMIVFTFGRNIQDSLVLNAAQSKLVALMSRSKSLAQQFALRSGDLDKEICGYGVHVDTEDNKIFIFQDMVLNPDPSATLCDPSDSTYGIFNSGEELSGELNNIDMDSTGLFIVDSGNPATDLINIVFIPPDPTIIINGDSSNTSGMVVLGANNTNTIASVKVNNFGQITVE